MDLSEVVIVETVSEAIVVTENVTVLEVNDSDNVSPRVIEVLAGEPGPVATMTIGTVTTVAPGAPASASVIGTAPNYTLNLSIPKGDPGNISGASVIGNLPRFNNTVGVLEDSGIAVSNLATLSGVQTFTGTKTFSATNTTVTGNLTLTGNLISAQFTPLISASNINLGSTTGDWLVTKEHDHTGGTNVFKHYTLMVRRAAGSDWSTADTYEGIGVDTSFGTPTTMKTWWRRSPNQDSQGFGSTSTERLTINTSGVSVVGNFSTTGTISGTLLDTALPARIGTAGKVVTDWNTAIENGWYRSSPNPTNGPSALLANWVSGFVQVFDPTSMIQTVQNTGTTSTDTGVWQRRMSSSTWSAWYKLEASQTANDNRYVMLTGSQSIAGLKNFTNGASFAATTTFNSALVSNSGNFEIGRVDGTASTPFIDFHSGATATDYDARIIASGGNGSNGQGALGITAIGGVSIAGTVMPTTNSTYNLGTASLKWNTIFGNSIESHGVGGNGLSLKNLGGDGNLFMQFFSQGTTANNTRTAYLGFSAVGATAFRIQNEINNADITLATTGTGAVNVLTNLSASGTVSAGGAGFYGAGTNITFLAANNITQGTLSDSRLSSNVILSTGSQTITGSKTFGSVLTVDLGGGYTTTVSSNFVQFNRAGFNTIQASVATGTIAIRTTNSTVGDVTNVTFSQTGGVATSTFSGNVIAGTFSGSGAGLTSIPANQLTNYVLIENLPVGTTDFTVAIGNHGHALTDANITGVLPIAQIPTGTTGTTVALGDHVHAGTAITSGTVAPARLGSGTPTTGTFLRGDGTWEAGTLNPIIPSALHADPDIESALGTNWVGTQSTAGGTISRDTTQFFTGTGSLKLNATATAASTPRAMTSSFTVIPGQVVEFGVWAKTTSTTGNPRMFIDALFKASGDPTLADPIVFGGNVLLTTTWTKYSYKFVVPSGVTKMRPIIAVDSQTGSTAVAGYVDSTWSRVVTQEVPIGGTTGQVLTKRSSTNYDVEWQSVGVWQSWTPTLYSLVVGTGGSVNARYTRIGNTVHFSVKIVLGTSGYAVGTDPSFTIPLTSVAGGDTFGDVSVVLTDAAAANHFGYHFFNTADSLVVYRSSLTPGSLATVNATSPFTWGPGDMIRVSGTYECA